MPANAENPDSSHGNRLLLPGGVAGETLPAARCVLHGQPFALPAGAPVVMMGGTFDPPHAWHVEIANAARRHVSRETGDQPQLVVVPTGESPLKGRTTEAGSAHRVAMARIAFAGVPDALVWCEEVGRAGLSFTFDTVARLSEQVEPGCRIWLVIGADQASQFHKWHRVEELLARVQVLIAPRPPLTDPAAVIHAMRASGAWGEAMLARFGEGVLDLPVSEVSSTALRGAVAAGMPTDLGAGSLATGVDAYIKAAGLYSRRVADNG
ncbi:MAG: nicotinate (nicotinamide) nucleotide adenylyltransferase [Phycisphaeraceae bacterium]|nr:nicotinate (nicotinamide) nucleotide adenylyltransferase [Phycisphaeraceae bacterium]